LLLVELVQAPMAMPSIPASKSLDDGCFVRIRHYSFAVGRWPGSDPVEQLLVPRKVAHGSEVLDSIPLYHWRRQQREKPTMSLGKDAQKPRAVHLPHMGEIVELPEVGGLHHRYERRAA
jgi:hypothetical protein